MISGPIGILTVYFGCRLRSRDWVHGFFVRMLPNVRDEQLIS
ncbi:hypothetical protein yaldo0001_7020 [Yersinia aldovae ATCC 35236]|nr:hypothetical protein yaldo0001_7020 [Yersinia aldovae ATCC 35236]